MSLSLLLLSRFQAILERTQFLTYDRVEPLLKSNRFSLPKDLSESSGGIRAGWSRWIQTHDREIRTRLLRGEEDTLVNFILFGVSFTQLPRVVLSGATSPASLIDQRIRAFITALAKPETDRLMLLSNLIARLGYRVAPMAESERLRQYIAGQVSRYLAEQQQYRNAVERSRTNDAASTVNGASALYKDRGLSIDTDFRPNYAIDHALADAKRRGLLKTVKRAAVIGPGLDFTDKDSGFDYYPLQTLQPFALIDSLLRQEMARVSDLKVSVFDISSLTLDHASQALAQARLKKPYTLQLVLDRTPAWTAGAMNYWKRMGELLGPDASPLPAPSQIRNVDRRAVQIKPEIVAALYPESLNIITQHVEVPPAERYDLIVATNILLYYDRFEQALALLNVEAMLKAGGVFLSNDLAENYSGLKLRSVASVSTSYTPTQADRTSLYTTAAFQPQFAPQ